MNNYLIIGQSYRLIDREIKKIIKDLNNIYYYDMDTDDLNNMIDEINYITLFDEKKIIICKNFNLKKAKDIDEEENNNKQNNFENKLMDYIENPNPQVILILISSNKLDERRKIAKLITKKAITINLLEISRNDLNTEVTNFFLNKSYKISKDVNIDLIRDKCLSNYDIIFNECEKLLIACEDTKEITESAIENNVSDYIGDEFFKIKDYIINKKVNKAYKLLENHLLSKKSIIPFLSLLANEYLLIYIVKNSSLSNFELVREIKIKNDYPIKLARDKANKFHNKELIDNIWQLADLDYKIKSGKIEENIGFNLFLLRII